MPLNHTSFYPTIYFMSLDWASFYWIMRHSIGLYTSCHWIGLHFIRSYVILTYHIFYVIGLGFMSLQRIILPENHNCVIESKFVWLDRRLFDGTIYIMPLDRSSCHWNRNIIPSGQQLIEKKVVSQNAFQIIFREVVLHRWCFAVWSVAWDGQLNESNGLYSVRWLTTWREIQVSRSSATQWNSCFSTTTTFASHCRSRKQFYFSWNLSRNGSSKKFHETDYVTRCYACWKNWFAALLHTSFS